MYVADLLRLFAGGDVDGLLLDEGPAPVGELIDPEARCRSSISRATTNGQY
jgi:hypothetical protein